MNQECENPKPGTSKQLEEDVYPMEVENIVSSYVD